MKILLNLSALASIATAADLYVDQIATGINDGSSWKNAFPDLQAALAAASPNDTIHIAEGLYLPDPSASPDPTISFVLPDSVTLLGGYEQKGVSRDPKIFRVILSGDIENDDLNADNNNIAESAADLVGQNSHTVLTTQSGTIDGLTITAGQALADGQTSTPKNSGAGLFVTGDATLNSVTVAGNSATRGAGAFISGNATLNKCHFYGNLSQESGGAIFVQDASPILSSVLFASNESQKFGGAIVISGTTASPSFNLCTFSQNNADTSGGALHLDDGCSPFFLNSILWHNFQKSSPNSPFASLDLDNATPTFSHCLIQHSGGSSSWNSTFGTDSGNNVDLNPLFENLDAPLADPSDIAAFRPMTLSPAVDQGLKSKTTPLDLLGQPRIQNRLADLGAIERNVLYVDQTNIGGAGSGHTWSTSLPSIQSALTNATPGTDIHIAAGRYKPTGLIDRSVSFVIPENISLRGGYESGDAFPDPEQHPTILTGDLLNDDGDANSDGITDSGEDIVGDNTTILINITGTGHRTTIHGLTLTSGQGLNNFTLDGGAIHISNASPTISHCRMIGNKSRNGGALSVGHSASQPRILDCFFEKNSATSQGGAIGLLEGHTVLERCQIIDCQAEDYGGGIGIFFGASLEALDCLIQDTGSPLGAAIHIDGASSLALTGCQILSSDSGGDGAALNFALQSAAPSQSLNRCQISGTNGRGIFFNAATEASVSNSLFSGNSSTSGGSAIRNQGTLTLTNTTVTGNKALGSPGAQSAIFSSSPALLTVANCIVWNNSQRNPTPVPQDSIIGDDVVISHSLVQYFSDTSDGNLDGTDPANAPFFIDPKSTSFNPTLLGDYRIEFGSPTLNLGDNSARRGSRDLLNNARIQNGTIDLGAYEGAITLPTTDTDGDGIPNLWEAAHTDPSSPTSLDPNSNTDGDPFTALWEFVHGLDPNSFEPQSHGYLSGIADGRFFMNVHMNPDARIFYNIIPEGSRTLGPSASWDGIVFQVTQGAGDWFYHEYLGNITIDPTYYFRIRITPR